VDALSRNPVGSATDDDDFGEEIQDIADTQVDVHRKEGGLLCVKTEEETEWTGVRRKSRQHHVICSGSNHWTWVGDHQLYMLDVAAAEDLSEEFIPSEEAVSTGNGPVQHEGARMVLKRKRPQYFDKQQQLDLALAAHEMFEFGGHELGPTESDDEEDHGVKSSCIDIWEDTNCLTLLKEGVLPDTVNFEESKRIKKRASNYCWKEQKFFFKALLVPEPKERMSLVRRMHEDLGHFEEQQTLAEIRRKYFWHNRIADVKAVIRGCQQCQLVRSSGSILSGDEQLKSIPICDLFHRVALDTVGPLPETKSGNKYILVAIDHYSKWCETKAVADHGAKTTARFLEDEIICRYGVPKFVLTNNGGEWAAKFDVMCRDYVIQHQRTAP
jgi:hypothetical protein